MHELIIDSFAGGGGASLGIAWATGKSPDIAINHDADAIKMHTANHPDTLHLREDVFKINPRKLTKGRPVGLLWASPDCRDFSRAKGGMPVSRRVRGLAWMVIKWAVEVQPRVIILENVREFEDWGPLVPQWCCRECDWKGTEGQAQLVRTRRRCPRCESRKLVQTDDRVRNPDKVGLTFKIWKGKLQAQGYKVEHRTLNAADYGAPTNRKRLFLVARCDGEPITWPEPTHAAPTKCGQRSLFGPKLKPHRTAAECIDFLLPIPSIFARKKPLKPKSQWRTAKGLLRYVLENPRPYIVGVGGRAGQSPATPADAPIGTVTGKNDRAVVQPIIVPMTHDGARRCPSVNEPLPTVTTAKRGEFSLAIPSLVQMGYGERDGQEARALDLNQPLGTVVASGQKHAVSAAMIAKFYGGVVGHKVDQPIGTVTQVDHHALVAASLTRFYGQSVGQLVDQPAPTESGCGHTALQAASLLKFRGDSAGGDLHDPLPTVTSGAGATRPAGAPHAMGIATAWLVRFNHGDKQWHSVHDPLGVVTTQGNKFGLAYAYLNKYYGSGGQSQPPTEPLHTATVKSRFAVVQVSTGEWCQIDSLDRPRQVAQWAIDQLGHAVDPYLVWVTDADTGEVYPLLNAIIDGVRYLITDICLRMLKPRELARAQGFPDTYLLSGVITNDVARIGNSVCPPIAKAMVEANYCRQEVAHA